MAVLKLARFAVRPDAREQAERAMHELAAYVRKELSGSTWTAYRDPDAPSHYIAFLRADDAAADERHRSAPGTQAFTASLEPLLVGTIEITECELVTSSDLQRRPSASRAPRRRPQRR